MQNCLVIHEIQRTALGSCNSSFLFICNVWMLAFIAFPTIPPIKFSNNEV